MNKSTTVNCKVAYTCKCFFILNLLLLIHANSTALEYSLQVMPSVSNGHFICRKKKILKILIFFLEHIQVFSESVISPTWNLPDNFQVQVQVRVSPPPPPPMPPDASVFYYIHICVTHTFKFKFIFLPQ